MRQAIGRKQPAHDGRAGRVVAVLIVRHQNAPQGVSQQGGVAVGRRGFGGGHGGILSSGAPGKYTCRLVFSVFHVLHHMAGVIVCNFQDYNTTANTLTVTITTLNDTLRTFRFTQHVPHHSWLFDDDVSGNQSRQVLVQNVTLPSVNCLEFCYNLINLFGVSVPRTIQVRGSFNDLQHIYHILQYDISLPDQQPNDNESSDDEATVYEQGYSTDEEKSGFAKITSYKICLRV